MKKKQSRRFKVPTLVEWRAEHAVHGPEQIEDGHHPRMCWHRCPCGSLLVTLTPEALAAATAASLQARAER